jgi:Putative auto-transporter adhesin, head GIN domain
MKKFALGLFAVLLMASTLKVSAQEVSEQTRSVSGFNSVSSAGPFRVHIIMGNTESVKLNIDAEYIDKVETVVENGNLAIRFKKSFSGWNQISNLHTADVTVSAKSLSALVNSGSGSVTVDGVITADDFKTVLSGSGEITAPSVKVSNELTARLSGSGSINIGGSSAVVNAQISGSGEIKAKGFSTSTATVTISGSGNVYLKADKQLTANLVGSGNVFYAGNAQTNTHKVGSGTVQKMD